MHPVSAALFEWKIITKWFDRRDWILGHKGNAVYKVWQNESVPMNRRRHLKLVNDFSRERRRPFPQIILRAVSLFVSDDSRPRTLSFLHEEIHAL